MRVLNIRSRLWEIVSTATLLHALLCGGAGITLPYRPELRIAESNGYVTVSWPQSAYYYTLVKNNGLGGTGSWSSIAIGASDFTGTFPYEPGLQAATNFVGDEIRFTTPASDAQAFYGMKGWRLIPVCQFNVFYDGLLEFSTIAASSFDGPIHANGNIYTGTGASVTFKRTVTTSGTITSPAWNGQGPNWTDTGTYNGTPPSVTNVAPLQVLSGLAFTNLHGMIDMPPLGESPSSLIGQSRLYNQAQVVLLVSNTTMSARIQAGSATYNPGGDPSPIYLWTTFTSNNLANALFPFLRTNSFYDAREAKTLKITQIDLGLYRNWLESNALVRAKFPPNSFLYPALLYVADCRTNSSSTMSAIRITNGVVLPRNEGMGFTLVTPNPLYVWGNYNCTNVAYLGTTNTSATVPSALICDALTILSANWKDAMSSSSLSSRTASSSETVNAAIVAGNVPSTGSSSSQFSGGVHNFPRLLENWSSSYLWLNTSLVCIYRSETATTQFQNPGIYYNPPTRRFVFDQNFTDPAKAPPGIPMVGIVDPEN